MPLLVSLVKSHSEVEFVFACFSRKYFKAVCDVDEPEVLFNMDQYTDVTRVTKPVIYISIQEMIDTHKLLLVHENAIAPDVNDVLHELLEDLGDVASVEELLGKLTADRQSVKLTVFA